MVIDDSLTVRKIMVISLQRADFQAASVGGGSQAIQALSRGDLRTLDAIVIEVELPSLNGYGLMRLFRQRAVFARMVILMLSGHTRWTSEFQARRVGATVLSKGPTYGSNNTYI